MNRFSFALATAADDAQLRARMAEDWMDGNIAVSFRREPSYFAGSRLQGDMVQTIVCRENHSNRIVGLGSRCSAIHHLNGQPCRIGYLSDLRADPRYRKGTLLARGYRLLRQLHQAGPLPAYFSVIFENNQAALQNLLGARAGLPNYIAMGKLLTPALHLDFYKPEITLPGITLRRASAADQTQLLALLNRRMASRQFSPVYQAADFLPGGRCSGLRLDDFFIAENSHGTLLATLAAWDQASVRQTHIERYSPALAMLRPFYNLLSAISPLKPLPAPGSRVPSLYLACVAVENDDIALLRALLRHAYRQLRSGPWHYAILGLHERDPLAAVLNDYRSIAAAGLLFRVEFDAASAATIDQRIPYIEMALA
jgi:hypothetical protein